MSPRTRDPIRMNFYPLSHQLGVGVEVELEEQVIVGRESCKMMNLQIMILRKLHMY